MSLAEFAQACAYLDSEPLDPALLDALAMMLASAANGALTRKDKRLWTARDFVQDRWPKPTKQEPQSTSLQDLQDFLSGKR